MGKHPIRRILKKACFGTALAAAASVAFLYWAYQVEDQGTLHLEKVPGTATITREAETGVAHIRGDSWDSVYYAQGFAHC